MKDIFSLKAPRINPNDDEIWKNRKYKQFFESMGVVFDADKDCFRYHEEQDDKAMKKEKQ